MSVDAIKGDVVLPKTKMKNKMTNVPPLFLDPLIRLHEIPKLLRPLCSDNARIDVRPTPRVVEDTRGSGCY